MEFSVITISAFVGVLNEITKFISTNVFGKDIKRFIPIFSFVYGLILGIIAWSTNMDGFGNTVIDAAFTGLIAGGAATGCHQIGKQLKKTDDGVTDEQTDGIDEVDLETPKSDFDLVDVTDVEDTENYIGDEVVDDEAYPEDDGDDINIDVQF